MKDSNTPKQPRKTKTIPQGETVLVLRTCAADMTSYGGFTWPESGRVEAPDWEPLPHCGNGLHGLLWGEGDSGLANWNDDAKWLVVEVEKESIIDLVGKVKFPRGVVVCCGTRFEATAYLYEHGGKGYAVIGGTATAGDWGTATAGDWGTATAGDEGTATAGDEGTATAGYEGTATAGGRGTATAGDWGTATAGDWGTITIKRWDGERHRFSIGYISENGLEANVPYRLDQNGAFVRADERAL
jgi:hypothetical protein